MLNKGAVAFSFFKKNLPATEKKKEKKRKKEGLKLPMSHAFINNRWLGANMHG
jgi:hypothetical protein